MRDNQCADYIIADCGHEVYEGEYLYEWDGKRICPDCMEEEKNSLSLPQFCELLGGDWKEVRKPKHERF